jgi:ABC-2 type transport system permease protein
VTSLALRQTAALSRRSVVTTLRIPQAWFPALFFPLVLMAIFTGSFGLAPRYIPGFPPVRGFLDFAVSGAILQGVLIGGTIAGAAFATDIEDGFFDRLVASPVSRVALLVGRFGASVTLALVQCVLFMAVALVFGARLQGGIVGMLIVMLFAVILSVAVGGLGVVLALRTGSSEAVQGTFPLIFALLFFSSAFFPRETMSGWFRHVADWNPISHVVEGMRAQVISGVEPGTTAVGLAIAAGLAVLAVVASSLMLRRRLGEAA